jgi:hypothetical protein
MIRDPTGTGKLRAAYRAQAQRRLQMLLRVTASVIKEDYLALSASAWKQGRVPFQKEQKLRAFSDWFRSAAYSTLVQEGYWPQRYLEAAYASGVKAASAITGHESTTEMDLIHSESARRELIGIVDAMVQRASRIVAAGLARRLKSRALAHELTAALRKLATGRLNALCNTGVVAAHNEGRLDQGALRTR